jgi:hypothetical protein
MLFGAPPPTEFDRPQSRLQKRRDNRAIAVDNTRTLKLSTFIIEDANIEKFRRIASRSNDCVINAMQIIGMISDNEAALLRIVGGDTGLTPIAITKMFTLYIRKKFLFKEMDFQRFQQNINQIELGQVVFAGYSQVTQGKTFNHVFLIGKNRNNKIYLVDPQLPEQFRLCDLSSSECFSFISGKNKYYLLFNNTYELTHEEQIDIVGKVVNDDRSFEVKMND